MTGVIAFQVPIDRVDAIIGETTGMGQTGETYAIDLDPDPDQAAAQLLEEIVASLRAQSATPPL